MLTPTHSLLALAVLTRKNKPKKNLAVLIGSLCPDAFIYAAWAIYTLSGNSQTHIWDVLYFRNPTQFFDAFFNSIPLYSALILIGFWLSRQTSDKKTLIGQYTVLFALAALIHIATDIPVHASDAHRHFWPISDWRFYSPLSYWEGDHHAGLVTLCEALLGLLVTIILWRRFDQRWARILTGLFIAVYILLFSGTLLFITGIIGANA